MSCEPQKYVRCEEYCRKPVKVAFSSSLGSYDTREKKCNEGRHDANKESLNKHFEDCNLSIRNSVGSPSLSLKAQFKLTVAKAGERWRHRRSADSKPHPAASPPSPSQLWAFTPLLTPREIHFQCTPVSRKCMLKRLLWAKVTCLKTTCTFEMLTYKQ